MIVWAIQHDRAKPGNEGAVICYKTSNIDEMLALAIEDGRQILYPKTSIGELVFVAEFENGKENRIVLDQLKKQVSHLLMRCLFYTKGVFKIYLLQGPNFIQMPTTKILSSFPASGTQSHPYIYFSHNTERKKEEHALIYIS